MALVLTACLAAMVLSGPGEAQKKADDNAGFTGEPDYKSETTGLPFFFADHAKLVDDTIRKLQDDIHRCDRLSYYQNVKIYEWLLKTWEEMFTKGEDVLTRKWQFDIEHLKLAKDKFPPFPLCEKPSTPPAPAPGGGGASATPAQPLVPHREARCQPCKGLADKYNQADDDYTAAVRRHDPDQATFRQQMAAYARELDDCEKKCAAGGSSATPAPGPYWVPPLIEPGPQATPAPTPGGGKPALEPPPPEGYLIMPLPSPAPSPSPTPAPSPSAPSVPAPAPGGGAMAPHPQAGCPPCQELGAKLNAATLGAIEAENRHDAAQASLFHQQAATYSRELGECLKTCWSQNAPEPGRLVAPVAPGPTVPGGAQPGAR